MLNGVKFQVMFFGGDFCLGMRLRRYVLNFWSLFFPAGGGVLLDVDAATFRPCGFDGPFTMVYNSLPYTS